MLNDPNFLPILQNAGWQGTERVTCKSLYAHTEPAPTDDIFLSYGVVGQTQNSFLTKSALQQQGMSIEQVDAIAGANLQRYIMELEWAPVNMNFNMLYLTGNAHTAAGVSLNQFLNQLHEYFNNQTVYLAVPNRFTILASDDSFYFGLHVHEKFNEAVQNNYGALSPHLIVMQNGIITGQAQMDPADLQAAQQQQAAPQPQIPVFQTTDPEDDIILNPAIQKGTGAYPASEQEEDYEEEKPRAVRKKKNKIKLKTRKR